jgi:hypothetical protein
MTIEDWSRRKHCLETVSASDGAWLCAQAPTSAEAAQSGPTGTQAIWASLFAGTQLSAPYPYDSVSKNCISCNIGCPPLFASQASL